MRFLVVLLLVAICGWVFLALADEVMEGETHAFDRAILAILQRDNTTPQRVIGERVNLSAPAVQRRIRRMEATGVIRANVAVVDPAALGHPITLFVEIELVSETAIDIDAAKDEPHLCDVEAVQFGLQAVVFRFAAYQGIRVRGGGIYVRLHLIEPFICSSHLIVEAGE